MRKITGAKESEGELRKLFLDILWLSSLKAAPMLVTPLARSLAHSKSSIGIGLEYIHLTSVEKVRTATFTSVSASPTLRISGISSSITVLSSPIFFPFILPDVSIRKNITRLFLETLVALRGSSSKSRMLLSDSGAVDTVSFVSKSSRGLAFAFTSGSVTRSLLII